MAKKYEVVIVGAGPAGLNCATVLAQNKKKVLVLEKNKKIGPKICAGGLTKKCRDQLNIPPSLLEREFSQLIVFLNKKKVKVAEDYPLVSMISRLELGQWMADVARESGAEIRTEARVTEIGENKIIINNNEEITFDSLVGADGSSSLVRKFLGLKTKKILISIGYQINKPLDQKNSNWGEALSDLEVYFDSKILPIDFGYFSIFPHRDYILVGLTAPFGGTNIRGLNEALNEWLNDRKIDIRDAKLNSGLINCDWQGYRFGPIYLVGDAAGLAFDLTGEGIYSAIVSGEEVARQILDLKYSCPGIKNLLNIKSSQRKRLVPLRKKYFRANAYRIAPYLAKNNLMMKKLMRKIF